MAPNDPAGEDASPGVASALKAQIDSVIRYSNLCRRLQDDPEEPSSSIWTLLERRVAFDEGLKVSLGTSLHLNSAELMQAGPLTWATELIPIMPDEEPWSYRITVNSARSHRKVSPVPPQSLDALLSEASPHRDRPYVAVALRRAEYTSCPVLELTRDLQSSVIHQPFRLRHLLPAARVESGLGSNSRFTPEVVICAPTAATTDVVAIDCRLDSAYFFNQVDDLVARNVNEYDAGLIKSEAAAEILVTHINRQIVFDLRELIGAIKDCINAAATNALGKKYASPKWVGDIHNRISALEKWLRDDWRSVASRDARPTLNQVQDTWEKLKSRFGSEPVVFTFYSSINELTGRVDLGDLANALRAASAQTYLDSVIIPFTTEGESGLQGRRSSLALFVFALVLVIAACVNLSWLPDWNYLASLPNHTPAAAANAQDREDNLRESLVTLLLFFPAVIYGSFFQTRPRTTIEKRAQLGTFLALSTVFSLPIFAGAALAAGAHYAYLSMALIASAAIAIAAGILVWMASLPSMLKVLRRSELRNWIRK